MAKKNVAVYDCSDTYIKRFLKYVNGQKPEGFSVIGFSEMDALKQYLENNRVDILLFSLEEQFIKDPDAEEVCAGLIGHPSVREFVYFGERRNSKSKVKHINKYQAAGKILLALTEILFPGREEVFPEEETGRKAELISVYAPAPEEEAAICALEIAELLSVRKEVLFLDLERFSLLGGEYEGGQETGLSDLIYVYQTNPRKLTECLRERRYRYHNMDILTAPDNMEDMDEIPEKEWPVFIQHLADSGGYDAVVVHLAEAFRNPEYLFDVSDRIYTPSSQSEYALKKMRLLAMHCCGKGRRDLYDKMQVVLTPAVRPAERKEKAGEEWNW